MLLYARGIIPLPDGWKVDLARRRRRERKEKRGERKGWKFSRRVNRRIKSSIMVPGGKRGYGVSGDIDQSVNFRDAWHPKAFLPGVGYWISVAVYRCAYLRGGWWLWDKESSRMDWIVPVTRCDWFSEHGFDRGRTADKLAEFSSNFPSIHPSLLSYPLPYFSFPKTLKVYTRIQGAK